MLGRESSTCHRVSKCSITELHSQRPSLKVYSQQPYSVDSFPAGESAVQRGERARFEATKLQRKGRGEEEEKKQHHQLVGGWRGAVEMQARTSCDTWSQAPPLDLVLCPLGSGELQGMGGWGAVLARPWPPTSWAHTLGCGFFGWLTALNSGLRGPGQRKAPETQKTLTRKVGTRKRARGSV